jgi:mannitol/fructose-specific phosphotransferase system IIA component (Ntr-type)
MSEWTAGEFTFPVVEIPPSAAMSPDAAITFLIQHLVDLGRIPARHAADIVCLILKRESQGSTALGGGVAVPHAKSNDVEGVVGIVGRSSAGIPWPGAAAGDSVREVCLLVTPAMKPGDSLRALEAVVARHRKQ